MGRYFAEGELGVWLDYYGMIGIGLVSIWLGLILLFLSQEVIAFFVFFIYGLILVSHTLLTDWHSKRIIRKIWSRT